MGTVSSRPATMPNIAAFGNFMQVFDAEPYRGKRISITMRVRVEYRHAEGPARLQVSWTDRPPPDPVPHGAWRADLYANASLAGYLDSRTEERIDENLDDHAPDPGLGNPNNWSKRWTGDWDFAEGTYKFDLVADDGARNARAAPRVRLPSSAMATNRRRSVRSNSMA